MNLLYFFFFFFFQAEDGIRDVAVTGVQTCALPIYHHAVVVDVGAGAVLGELGNVLRGEDRGRAPARDDGHGDARALEQLERALQELARAGLAVGEGHEALEAQAAQPHGGSSQLERRLWGLGAGAPEARVALDAERDLGPRRARRLT